MEKLSENFSWSRWNSEIQEIPHFIPLRPVQLWLHSFFTSHLAPHAAAQYWCFHQSLKFMDLNFRKVRFQIRVLLQERIRIFIGGSNPTGLSLFCAGNICSLLLDQLCALVEQMVQRLRVQVSALLQDAPLRRRALHASQGLIDWLNGQFGVAYTSSVLRIRICSKLLSWFPMF